MIYECPTLELGVCDQQFVGYQGCHGQGKMSGKRIFLQVREKSGNFNFSQGNLEKMIKVREKSGNLRSLQKSKLVKVLKIIISINCK